MLQHLAYAIQFVTDIDASKHFYHDQLGLTVRSDHGTWVEFETGQTVFALHAGQPLPAGARQAEAMTVLTFAVESVKKAEEWLRSRGVMPIEPPHEVAPQRYSFDVLDPDGLMVSIYGPM